MIKVLLMACYVYVDSENFSLTGNRRPTPFRGWGAAVALVLSLISSLSLGAVTLVAPVIT